VKRARYQRGSVVFNRRSRTWHYLWTDEGHRRSKLIGSIRDYPTKSSAWDAVESAGGDTTDQLNSTASVATLISQYRIEKMPQRFSTKRGYEAWLKNYIEPRWGNSQLTDLQPRPVELWLRDLTLSPKSKVHIRGLLRMLWDYAMWRGDVLTERNPMELVRIKGASKRMRKPPSLTVEQFHLLLQQFGEDRCFRTLLLIAISFGLRVSEVLALKWQDVDWLGKRLRIVRGIVRQIVGDVKSERSAAEMVVADDLLAALAQWRQESQFSDAQDWVFASPVKLGRLPLSYTFVSREISKAAQNAGIGHVTPHCFRHTYRTWLDSIGTPIGVQQKLMRHADIRTTMNYGDAVTDDMRQAHEGVVRLAMHPLN
jgi:integrase